MAETYAIAVEHIVKKRIAGIIVILAIAAQPGLVEQGVIERGNGLGSVADIGNASLGHTGEFVDARDVGFDVEVRILASGDGQRSPNQIDVLIADLGANQGRKGLSERGLAMGAHGFMLAEQASRTSYFRSRFLAINSTFAGRSARRRIR